MIATGSVVRYLLEEFRGKNYRDYVVVALKNLNAKDYAYASELKTYGEDQLFAFIVPKSNKKAKPCATPVEEFENKKLWQVIS